MIYFVQKEDGLIKIGVTKNFRIRARALKYEHGASLKILKLITGDFKTEKYLHKMFKTYRADSEWFRPEKELIQFIESQTPLNENRDSTPKEITELGRNLKLARLRRGWKISELQQESGVGVQTIKEIEEGFANVSFYHIFSLLKAFGLTEDVALIAKDDKIGRKLLDAALLSKK